MKDLSARKSLRGMKQEKKLAICKFCQIPQKPRKLGPYSTQIEAFIPADPFSLTTR